MPSASSENLYRAALYIRLSREDGDKFESNSISNQRELIYNFLKSKSDIEVCCEKVDDGYSGITFDRPAMKELLADIKAGFINCVIVKDLSRFGRNYIETGRYIQQIFPFMGVRFIAINDDFDSASTSNKFDDIILPFKNLMNDSYCRDISIKVRSQIAIHQKNGDFIGAFPVYGYIRSKENKHKLVIDDVSAQTVRDIFRLRMMGYNNKKISEHLNELGVPSPMEYKALLNWAYTTSFKLYPRAKWSPTAVDRILKNEIYAGVMLQGKETTQNYKIKKRVKIPKEDWFRVESTHEAIILKEDFETVQKLMLCDTRTSPEKTKLYLFSGFLCCGGCGSNMVRKVIKSNGKTYSYYICSKNKENKNQCSSHRVNENQLTNAILFALRNHVDTICSLEDIHNLIDRLPPKQEQVQRLDKLLNIKRDELTKYQKLRLSLYEDYKQNILTKAEYVEMKGNFDLLSKETEESIVNIENDVEKLTNDRGSYIVWIEEYLKNNNIPKLTRTTLALLVEKIVVLNNSTIKIYFKHKDEFESTISSLKLL